MGHVRIARDIQDPETLSTLLRDTALPRAVRLGEALPLSGDDRLAWERRLNRHLDSCGCAAGAIGLLIGIAGIAIMYVGWREPWTSDAITRAIAWSAALPVAGKLAGRQLGRLRFRRTCRQLASRLAAGSR